LFTQLDELLRRQWEAERRVQALREKIDRMRKEIAQAQRDSDFETAAALMDDELPELEQQLEDEEEELAFELRIRRLLREEITEEEIAPILARWTHIRVSAAQAEERKMPLDKWVEERGVGLEEEG
jgi:ATP-dependent Clp protease ATP-binding subunit ClpB